MSTVFATTPEQWREWLDRHGQSEPEAWLVIFHKDSGTPSVSYREAVEQALCFGWIDSHHRKRDSASSELRFSPRTQRSRWSPTNRERAARMVEAGLMTERGQAAIDRAKADGLWEPPRS